MKNEYYCYERREVLDLIPNVPTTVLELGCGEGDFGSLLKQTYQCKVTGIELCAEAASKAKEKLDTVYNTSIEEFDLTQLGKVDLIVANDLLEHLKDPWSVVSILRNNLCDDGCFIASIPNIRHYKIFNQLFIEGNWEYVESGLLDRTHLRFFTRKTMMELFQHNQYVVKSISPINVKKIKARPRNILRLLLKYFLPDLYTLQFVVVAQKQK
ncbi:bifunctional 3-demethylubiquinone-9 3-methyltransferase/ 2-octaprenyl-6-hydroxy phenol methylase [Sporomusa ovata DSM 2662]|uniref:Possible glycosyltransferase n=1 Tax=Sporomusa ovata TaxID=2378 RepID=A0A0U1KSZ4_9FIRM|nr:class I SAM-dependent methyltransferase [Sporomusa ovata]EQB26466.1 methyltransferase domain containing protein [Sporomusa ovata DSM 2662]CQR70550.1 Possible glycosyltransferase [Sporomusa ovata]